MHRTNIIAEIGWNHLGDIDLAIQMIRSAASCGADYVKFQVWSVENLKPGPWDSDGRRQLYEKAEFSDRQLRVLFKECTDSNIKFMASVFNEEDLDKLPFGYMDIIKIPSPEISNLSLLDHCNNQFEHIIISTGASTEEEIVEATRHCDSHTLMHCVSMYPCPKEKANLLKIKALQEFALSRGFSDHTTGTSAAIYAICQGCDFVEKHFTTDNNLPGRDNKFSADPTVLQRICNTRDEITLMTDNFQMEYFEEEQDVRQLYRSRWLSY